MHRFYLPPEQCRDAQLVLAGREAHHALHVLRVHRGEEVTVLDGAGNEFLCEVQEPGRDQIRLEVREKRWHPRPPCLITLLEAIPKGKTFETIIQKATELGAACVVPLLSERVEVRLKEREAIHKVEKWRAVGIEAIKQCGSAWLPKIESPVSPEQYLARKPSFDLSLVASLQPDARHPREYLQAAQAAGGKPQSVCVWIGPEGDFSPAEMGAIKDSGAQPMTLGRLVLRTDTAAVYCLSILSYELGSVAADVRL